MLARSLLFPLPDGARNDVCECDTGRSTCARDIVPRCLLLSTVITAVTSWICPVQAVPFC